MKRMIFTHQVPLDTNMPTKRLWTFLVLFLLAGLIACQGNEDTEHNEHTNQDAADEAVEQPCDDINNEINEGEEDRVGFEIIEQLPDGTARAWVSPVINFDEFAALELPDTWIKNQPRESSECGSDQGRFLKSPDAAEGEILFEEHFGFTWFHAATVTQIAAPLDEAGLLRGITVKKYHELTYNPGSCMIALVAPDGEVYFRIGRDATRTCNTPTLPDDWRLVDYVVPETLVIELFDESLVIRTDNEDSFQGPVPQLKGLL